MTERAAAQGRPSRGWLWPMRRDGAAS